MPTSVSARELSRKYVRRQTMPASWSSHCSKAAFTACTVFANRGVPQRDSRLIIVAGGAEYCRRRQPNGLRCHHCRATLSASSRTIQADGPTPEMAVVFHELSVTQHQLADHRAPVPLKRRDGHLNIAQHRLPNEPRRPIIIEQSGCSRSPTRAPR